MVGVHAFSNFTGTMNEAQRDNGADGTPLRDLGLASFAPRVAGENCVSIRI
jgi:hypothetical protein